MAFQKSIKVACVTEFVEQFLAKLRSSTLFRGHRECGWDLLPMIDRVDHGGLTRDDHEHLMIEEFNKKSRLVRDLPFPNAWELHAVARHHGVPTRLLDWSESPLTALFFATLGQSQGDSVVWCYCYIAEDRGLDINSYASPLKVKDIILFDPPQLHPRIAGQSGQFTVHPTSSKDFDKWPGFLNQIIIPKDNRSQIRHELFRLGIHYHNLFPDLNGIGTHIYNTWCRQPDEPNPFVQPTASADDPNGSLQTYLIPIEETRRDKN
ncbi:MAG: FRG domain-containing protein [Desulfobacterales bacterium]|nr:FRG domain-containing protein [Desulfobacterales bacterium]